MLSVDGLGGGFFANTCVFDVRSTVMISSSTKSF